MDELLAIYDTELRGRGLEPMPEGAVAERDGPLVRISGLKGGGFVDYDASAGVEGEALDELIARQVRFFADRDEEFEWKVFAYDQPADLADRLAAAGFEPEETETLVIARLTDVAGEVVLPDGVTIREITTRTDLDRIAVMEQEVWQDGKSRKWLADALELERAAAPELLTIFVAEAGDAIVCAAWLRFDHGTSFASLWGGATLAEWRGRGIYRAMVAQRANVALAHGYELVTVDASEDSRPILERLGFKAVTTTTPWIWSPPRA